jgi:selenocysteine-specific elongation factor
LLLGNGRLIRLRTVDRKASIVLHSDVVADAKHRIRQRYPHPEKFTIANIRDLFGSTRKYIVPLMEHFDAVGTTVRVGDHRYLKEP